MKKLLFAVLLVVIFAAGVLFVVFNDQPAEVNFLLFQTPPLSVGLWLLAALGIGVLIGIFSSSFSLLRLQARNRRLAKDKQIQQQELQTLLKEKQ